jgi:hypothetical protein
VVVILLVVAEELLDLLELEAMAVLVVVLMADTLLEAMEERRPLVEVVVPVVVRVVLV